MDCDDPFYCLFKFPQIPTVCDEENPNFGWKKNLKRKKQSQRFNKDLRFCLGDGVIVCHTPFIDDFLIENHNLHQMIIVLQTIFFQLSTSISRGFWCHNQPPRRIAVVFSPRQRTGTSRGTSQPRFFGVKRSGAQPSALPLGI
jgi:hypothetical protein